MNQLNHLVTNLQKGNYTAFDAIYKLTYRPIFFVAYSILKDKLDSEDVLQETYIKFYDNISSFTSQKNIFNWFYTVAKNLSINKLKKKNKITLLDFIENIEDTSNNIEKNINFQNLLHIASKNLSKEEFLIITLCTIKGFKRREVASMLNKPISTITWIYNNAIKKLRNKLKGGIDEN